MMVKDHFFAVVGAATSEDRHDRPAALSGLNDANRTQVM